MKKLLMVCLCLLLWGCGSHQQPEVENKEPKSEFVDKIGWIGEYQKDDVRLIIIHNDDYPNGFEFQIEIDTDGFGEYTRYISEDQKEAVYDTQEDGYTLHFTLKDDRIIVVESGGLSYLNTDLSGEYKKI